MSESRKPPPNRRALQRSRSNFLTRTATDTAAQLDRRFSTMDEEGPLPEPRQSGFSGNVYEPLTNASKPVPHRHELSKKLFGSGNGSNDAPIPVRRTSSGRQKSSHGVPGGASVNTNMPKLSRSKSQEDVAPTPRIGALPRPVGGHEKLGTFSGVFVPTTLNVLSILMFLRFGFILGQSGVLGMMGMLIISYIINLITTLSISAIATNGTVRGGGAYYLISRSLGPEFGGSIGIVFFLGLIFNTGLNAVGLIDCLKQNFGEYPGGRFQWILQNFWWQYLAATIVLVICTGICLAGSGIFARCSNGLLAILLVATFSIPFSIFLVKPFESRSLGIEYTGLSLETFKGNLYPSFTKGADGSQSAGKESFQSLFGILFSATGGIFAGASMSGDLQHPSKAIPTGTLSGLALTFVAYTLTVLAMAATVTRPSFYRNVNVIHDINVSGALILLGELATSFFSSLMGLIGAAKLLQALARDHLLPGFSIFGQGTKKNDEPRYAIILTYLVGQLTMLCNINQIASFVTMSYLLTFLIMNLATFLLKISSAPNFRPSFHYFNWGTAAFGTLISGLSMFYVDRLYATGCVGMLVVIFLIIHYTSPPKSWGDVSQSLIYHQIRKYLLRLKKEHVKFWRPQILLFVNDPRHQYKLIQFCNSLKKGSLFILGHVIVTTDFGNAVPEARQQEAAWMKYIDFSKVKAFVNIAISPAVEWGIRNIVIGSGLGGMRPNIVIMGFYNLNEYRQAQPLVDVPSAQHSRNIGTAADGPTPAQTSCKFRRRDSKAEKLKGLLPTDDCRAEVAVGVKSYVTMLEDLLLKLQINVAVAKGFKDLEFPQPKEENSKKYIDLWPIQMSAEIAAGEEKQNVLTTNFDTYTLILQLGCILNTVPRWKKVYKLRVAVFVEYESDVEEERGRVETLLDNLRIQAEVLVFWLASGDLKTYQVIVNGAESVAGAEAETEVNEVLQGEEWWRDVRRLRRGSMSASEELADAQGLLDMTPDWPSPSFQHGRREDRLERFEGLKKFLRKSKRRPSVSGLQNLGVNLGMRTHRLHDDLIHNHAAHASASEESSSSEISEDESSSQDKASVASADDLGDFESDAGINVRKTRSLTEPLSRRSDGDSLKGAVPFDLARLRQAAQSRSDSSIAPDVQDSAIASDPDLPDTAARSNDEEDPYLTAPTNTSQASQASSKTALTGPTHRPRPIRQASVAKFTSNPTPPTTVATTEDGPGPSIMFSDPQSPSKARPHQSIYHRQSSNESRPGTFQNAAAGGFPFQQAVPLSFNDLPCRAQHLILNELIRQHSQDTAVIFTTLPSPVEGTCKSEEDSISYVSDLEILCQDLPPVLLVQSNSLTVTMNL